MQSSVEHRTETFSLLDPDLQNKLAQLQAEGWQIVPGTHPIAIYHLERHVVAAPPPQPAAAGVGRMHIDESQITIIRGGKPS
jgi:hypothetical protein